MNKRFALFALLLIVPMLLAACGSDMEPADAEKGLKAAFQGDFDTADDFVCDKELDTLRGDESSADLTALMADMEIEVSCEKTGGDMKCTVSIAGTEAQTMTFNIDGGKLCGEA